jgi:hypothetical protein
MKHGPNSKIPINMHNASDGPVEEALNLRTIPYVTHRLNGGTVFISHEFERLATACKIESEPQKTSGPRTR